ncbi:hypothetical protein OK074_5546 [Actinobacteria bacterium OK074]|nr:hypothetical protein OK074_5546 [Actinobacteria bacterium OK074]
MNARIAAVSVVTAALVAGGAGAAIAAPAKAAPKPSISIKASTAKAKKGQIVTFTGKVVGLKDGSKVTLQVKDGAKWVSLPAATSVKKGTYKLSDKFKEAGVEVLRVKDGKAASKSVSVAVR